jgi:DNA modification methylase
MLGDRKYWLMRGDCLERMKEIPDGSVDMILCDM